MEGFKGRLDKSTVAGIAPNFTLGQVTFDLLYPQTPPDYGQRDAVPSRAAGPPWGSLRLMGPGNTGLCRDSQRTFAGQEGKC